jgi:hypothetical protein
MKRDELRETLIDQTGLTIVGATKLADELMPHIDAHVQAEAQAALKAQRESIAKAIREMPHGETQVTPWLADLDLGWRHCRQDVLKIIEGGE